MSKNPESNKTVSTAFEIFYFPYLLSAPDCEDLTLLFKDPIRIVLNPSDIFALISQNYAAIIAELLSINLINVVSNFSTILFVSKLANS